MCEANLTSTNVEKPLRLQASPYSGQRRTPTSNWNAITAPTRAIQFQGSSSSPPSKRKFVIDILDRVFEILEEETDTKE
jgi:hypothetical protein